MGSRMPSRVRRVGGLLTATSAAAAAAPFPAVRPWFPYERASLKHATLATPVAPGGDHNEASPKAPGP